MEKLHLWWTGYWVRTTSTYCRKYPCLSEKKKEKKKKADGVGADTDASKKVSFSFIRSNLLKKEWRHRPTSHFHASLLNNVKCLNMNWTYFEHWEQSLRTVIENMNRFYWSTIWKTMLRWIKMRLFASDYCGTRHPIDSVNHILKLGIQISLMSCSHIFNGSWPILHRFSYGVLVESFFKCCMYVHWFIWKVKI